MKTYLNTGKCRRTTSYSSCAWVYVSLSACQFVCLSATLSSYLVCLLPPCLSACLLPPCLPACLSVCLPACLSVCLSVCLSISTYHPACQSICMRPCLPICMQACLTACTCSSMYMQYGLVTGAFLRLLGY